jgi:DNA-binding response OmpR family regulator
VTMPSHRSLLVVTHATAPWLEAFRACAAADGWSMTVQTDLPGALSRLGRQPPHAILMDATVPQSLALCSMARSKPALADLPILALVPSIDDATFSHWLATGADDVLPADPHLIVNRLRSMPARSLRGSCCRGRAVVLDADPRRCDVLGRVLRQAGFSVDVVPDPSALRAFLARSDVHLVVARADATEARALVEQAPTGPSGPLWVVEDPALEPWSHPRPIGSGHRGVVMNTCGLPEAILFATNTLCQEGNDVRGSPRLLYGTTVTFRTTAGAQETGFAFNASANGMFVRTLVPPPIGPVEIELKPPLMGARYQLDGVVVWRNVPSDQLRTAAPPGFGVRLLGPHAALKGWRSACDLLSAICDVTPLLSPQVPRSPNTDVCFPPPPAGSLDFPDVFGSSTPQTLGSPRVDAPLPTSSVPAPRPAMEATSVRPAPTPASAQRDLLVAVFLLLGFVCFTALGAAGGWYLFRPRPVADLPPLDPSVTMAVPSDPVPLAPLTATAPIPEALPNGSPLPLADPCPAFAAGDGDALLSYQGLLTVCSASSLDVYANGVRLGKTNERLVSFCHLKHVRLGEGSPAAWKTKGNTVHVPCRGATRITIDPDP